MAVCGWGLGADMFTPLVDIWVLLTMIPQLERQSARLLSLHPSLLMHFNLSHCQFPSTDSPTFLPFFFFFSCADKCGGNIEIHTADYLTSPGYPGAYPPSQQCVWVITAPEPGQKILINFNPHFDLEDRDCK